MGYALALAAVGALLVTGGTLTVAGTKDVTSGKHDTPEVLGCLAVFAGTAVIILAMVLSYLYGS